MAMSASSPGQSRLRCTSGWKSFHLHHCGLKLKRIVKMKITSKWGWQLRRFRGWREVLHNVGQASEQNHKSYFAIIIDCQHMYVNIYHQQNLPCQVHLGMSVVAAFVELRDASSPFTFLTSYRHILILGVNRILKSDWNVRFFRPTYVFLFDPECLGCGCVRLCCRPF